MDPDPDIEASKRESESRHLDLMDEKQAKPVPDIVITGACRKGQPNRKILCPLCSLLCPISS